MALPFFLARGVFEDEASSCTSSSSGIVFIMGIEGEGGPGDDGEGKPDISWETLGTGEATGGLDGEGHCRLGSAFFLSHCRETSCKVLSSSR